jgi:hypothetical protein
MVGLKVLKTVPFHALTLLFLPSPLCPILPSPKRVAIGSLIDQYFTVKHSTPGQTGGFIDLI